MEAAAVTATVDDVLEEVERSWGPCAALYYHGSTIFGNKKPTDIDLLAIIDEPTLRPVKAATTDAQFSLGPFEVSVYTRSFWLRKLEEMDLTMLTCLSLPPHFVVRALEDDRVRNLVVDIDKLSSAILSYAEYTWIKARRVLLRWNDAFKSSKNVYFVFRVLELGRQLVESGRILDFTAANHWWERIHDVYTSLTVEPRPRDWDVVEVVLASEFQAEKERFLSSVAAKLQSTVPPTPPFTQRHNEEHCSVCLEALDGSGKQCTLVTCGHTFHISCIARCVRDCGATCPNCRQPVRYQLDEDAAISRELERRGITEGREVPQRRRRRRFGGYPATILLDEEPNPAEEEEAEAAVATENDGPEAEVEEALESPEEPVAEPVAQNEPTAQEELTAQDEPTVQEEEPKDPSEVAPEEATGGSSAGSSLGEWELVEGAAETGGPAPAVPPATSHHCRIT